MIDVLACWAAVAVCILIAAIDPVGWVQRRRARRAAAARRPDPDLPPPELRRRLGVEVTEVLHSRALDRASLLQLSVTDAWRRAERAPRAEA